MNDSSPAAGSLLDRLIPSRAWQIVLMTGLILIAGGIVMLAVLSMTLTPTLPPLDRLGEDRLKVPMRVYTADNVLIGEFGEERRIPVKLEEVPATLIKAILAAEDGSFYQHHGVDFMGIARAAWINFRSGQHRQGASTITMQVARNFFLSPEKTYTRKLKEVLLSFKLERELGKDKILELYMNKIFLGHRAYGFAAAARIYYGKLLPELTLPEMAMLAGMPKAPSSNNPISNPKTALERRNYVLQRMHKLGYIDEAVLTDALTTPLSARKHSLDYDVDAPYIAEMVRQYMIQAYDKDTYGGGFHVYTTIQSKNQQASNTALRAGLLDYERRHGYRGPAGHVSIKPETEGAVLDEILKDYRSIGKLLPAIVRQVDEQAVTAYTQDGFTVEVGWPGLVWARRYIDVNTIGREPKKAADILKPGNIIYLEQKGDNQWWLAQIPQAASALVSLRASDGAIQALTGGFDFYDSKFNRVIQAERQAGSNIKPFLYSAALEKGFTAASTVSGAPIAIEDETLEDVWRPENYSGRFYGRTRLRKSLTLSLNLVSIRLLRAIGASYTVDYLSRFGFDPQKLPPNLALALGSASVTPLAMARAYGVFASGGHRVEPYFISRIEDADHNILEQANPLVVCQKCPGTPVLTTTVPSVQTSANVAATPEVDVLPVPADTPILSATPQAPRYAPQAIAPQNSFIMTTIMQDVIKHGTGRKALALGRGDLAGKTGTTNEYRDAWFSGFNSDVVTTVWIGFDQPASMGRGEAGSRAALPIWVNYMKVALEGLPENPPVQPEGIVKHYINSETGEIVPDPVIPEEGEPVEDEQSGVPGNEGEALPTDDDLALQEPPEPSAETQPIEIIEEYFVVGTETGSLQATGADSGPTTNTSSGQAVPITPPKAPEHIPQDLF